MTSRFEVVHRRADAATLHEFEPPDRPVPTLVVAEVTDDAQVLGSTQRDTVADADAAATEGVAIVRRRSGGGAVRLSPGGQIWVDVWIPAGDDRWDDDVVRAAIPVGEAWRTALEAIGVADLHVHDGGVVPGRAWADLVCFAGVGPGEVVDGAGAKWVGLSQRRTRDWIRLQTMVHRRWSPAAALVGLRLDPDEAEAASTALHPVVGAIGELDPLPALIAALG